MSDLSNYAENAIGNHVLRNTSMTSPAAVYLAMFTAVSDSEAASGTEVSTSGTAYARQAITFGAPTNGVFTNSAQLTYPQATAPWGTVTHFAVYDALTVGNAISSIKALGSSVIVGNTDQLIFDAAAISVTFA